MSDHATGQEPHLSEPVEVTPFGPGPSASGVNAGSLGFFFEAGMMPGTDKMLIAERLIYEWWAHFLGKGEDYDDGPREAHRELGLAGQYSDLHRKMPKLKKALWEGRSLAGEQPREILMDFIGNAFLAIAMIDAQEEP